MEEDIRLKILYKLREANNSTAEFKNTEFLKSLSDDLGSIKRALVELLNLGFISESNKDWKTEKDQTVIYSIDTKGPKGSPKKDPERLTDKYPVIRLIITIKGLDYLNQRERAPLELESIEKSIQLANTTIVDFNKKNKYTKYSIWIALAALIVSGIFNYMTYIKLYDTATNNQELDNSFNKEKTQSQDTVKEIKPIKNQKKTSTITD